MNTKNRPRFGGFGVYAMLILLVIILWYTFTNNSTTSDFTQNNLWKAISEEKVVSIRVEQNREVPTGYLNIKLKDGSTERMYTSDVNEIQKELKEKDFTQFVVDDVPSESWIMTLLPYLLIFGAIFILFMIMSNNAAANNSGGKMMNFGKSRAKLSTEEDNHMTFENVAGLKEEKEELEELVDFLRAPKKYTNLGARIPKGVLLVGPPGTGKTLLAKTFAKSIGGQFKRVQFTPDLMPSDITGLSIYNRKSEDFVLVKGPVFTNILLADEINRATPRTQSSLLEAMEEQQVTIDGESHRLEAPFFVIATENPIETTGTYPLPEAQLDRFLIKISMGDNSKATEVSIMDRFMSENPFDTLQTVCDTDHIKTMQEAVREVFVHPCVKEYIADMILATRNNSRIQVGASSRGTVGLLRLSQAYAAMEGRTFVRPDDVRYMAPYVLAHRVIMAGHMDEKKEKAVIRELVDQIAVPVEDWEN